MNNFPSEPKSGATTSEFKTWITSIVISVLMPLALSRGWLTQGQVSTVTAEAPIIGGMILALVSTVTYMLTRLGVKWQWMRSLQEWSIQHSLASQDDESEDVAPAPAPVVDPVTTSNGTPLTTVGGSSTLLTAVPGVTIDAT